jgi:hypothetical protein
MTPNELKSLKESWCNEWIYIKQKK